MLSTAFTLKLGHPIESGQVVVGKFDGKNPSLACATVGGKILLHCPHDQANTIDSESSIKFLNFNRKVTAIGAGPLNKSGNNESKDILFVGTNTNILAYDIDRNADLFFRDVQDGVNTLVFGKFGTYPPMLMVGGNCSLVGFDAEGNESFWTVTGDNVSSMIMADVNSDGITELVVGSEDFEIRVFRDEEVLEEITEVDKITFLRKIGRSSYAYGLANGTVGVYNGSKGRLWRVKTKHIVTSLSSFDINADGAEEILIGWNNGAFHVRNSENGDLMFKDKFSSPVAGIVVSDYRKDGKEEIIVCCESGDVKAYVPADAETIVNESSSLAAAESEDQRAILELYEKKRELANDLKSLEKSMKMSRSTEPTSGGLSNNTSLSYQLYPDFSLECLVLKVDVTPADVMIVNLVVIDQEGGILSGCEVLAITPSVSGKPASINLHPNKFNSCTIRVQTHVAARGAPNQLHVFEKDIFIPKFCSFLKLPDHTGGVGSSSLTLVLGDVVPTEPLSKVVFKTSESTSRIADYINSAFLLPQPFKCNSDKLRTQFINVCSTSAMQPGHRQPLHISASRDESDSELLKVTIKCDTLDLAAELVQDMTKYLKISELSSYTDFPVELAAFEGVLKKVNECNSARITLAADMADESQLVKALIVRAEDSRLLADMKTMRKAYTQLYSLNNQLISNYNLRSVNHETLLASLKEVNNMIQKLANLRVGKAKAALISDCRNAVKENDMDSLLLLLRQGNHGSADLAIDSKNESSRRK